MILDEHMPAWDVHERHSIMVSAPPERTLAAARAFTAREAPVMRLLMGVRTFPLGLLRRSPRRPVAPVLDSFARMGFDRLGESDAEVALGGVGRFWQPNGGLRRVPGPEFASFEEPGYVKAGFNFVVSPGPDGGCVLSTETRVLATDALARRRFRLYWALVRPGSGLIRRDWLRAIRKRAEGR